MRDAGARQHLLPDAEFVGAETSLWASQRRAAVHSALIPNSMMIGRHFSMSEKL
jgi:hypothetical protein